MKNYDDLTNRLLERRDRYVAEQKKKKQRITRATVSVGSVALVSLAGFALYKNGGFRENLPVTDGAPTTTTTTATPTQTGSATGTTGAQPTATTTPTKDTTAPSKTEATKTTAPSQTEPSTTTTTTKRKVVINGDEPDTNGAGVNQAGAYKHGFISPLLKETMEKYKDVDDVDVLYAVIVAVQYKEADDYEDAYNAFLESDEMVELAKKRDLAREEWKAVDAIREANIGNEEIAAEIIDDYYRTKEAYRSLRWEYDEKVRAFRDAHKNAGLEESIALLSEFSDIALIPLKDRLKPDMDWSEESLIRSVLILSEYEEHAYVAVLSADEILELSERIGCMYWLDSYDEDYYIAGMLNH